MNDPVRLTGQENFISENIPQGSPFALVRVLNMRLASGKLSSTEVALYEHMRKTEIRKTVFYADHLFYIQTDGLPWNENPAAAAGNPGSLLKARL